MSSSDKRRLRRSARTYLLISASCVLFSAVYEHFSHGVYSGFMLMMFLCPLIGGAVPLALTFIGPARVPSRAASGLWGSGVATLTLGCCLRGIFDIYGTVVPLVRVYWVAGALLSAAAAAAYLFARPESARLPR